MGGDASSPVRFEKRVMAPLPVDSAGSEVESWLFHRGPLSSGRERPPRVVVVHGLGDAPVTWFSCLRHALAGCEIVLPALPGAGRGPLPPGRDHLDFGSTTAWLTQLLGALVDEEGPVTVVGHSLGGWLTMRALLADRSLADRLQPPILINPAGTWYEGVERERELLSPRHLEDVDELLMQLYASAPQMPVEAMQSLLETMKNPGYRGLLDSAREEDFLRPRDIRGLPEKTGLVWGLADGLVAMEAFDALRANLREARVEELAFCGHAPHLEAPRKTGEVLARLVH